MSEFYATFNADRTLDLRLIKGIHVIPKNATLLSESQWYSITQETDCVWMIEADGSLSKKPMPPPSDREQIIAALAQRDSLLNEAAARMAPLQDAVDVGDTTPDEASKLIAWKRYRVALNRIEQQQGFPQAIEWPVQPNTNILV